MNKTKETKTNFKSKYVANIYIYIYIYDRIVTGIFNALKHYSRYTYHFPFFSGNERLPRRWRWQWQWEDAERRQGGSVTREAAHTWRDAGPLDQVPGQGRIWVLHRYAGK